MALRGKPWTSLRGALVLVTQEPSAASFADQTLFLVDEVIADTMASPTPCPQPCDPHDHACGTAAGS